MGKCNSKPCYIAKRRSQKVGRKSHYVVNDIYEDDCTYEVYNTKLDRHLLHLKKKYAQKRKYKKYTPIVRKYPRKLSDDSDCDSMFEKRYPYNPYINRTSPMRPMEYDSDSESRYESPKIAHVFSDDESECSDYPSWIRSIDISESSTILSMCFGELESPTE